MLLLDGVRLVHQFETEFDQSLMRRAADLRSCKVHEVVRLFPQALGGAGHQLAERAAFGRAINHRCTGVAMAGWAERHADASRDPAIGITCAGI